ncbi:hypothetical protein PQ459_14570 [Chryseobacterium sp. KACC 21268]|nr:hypothetical protein PQ459_14570 [Chryseobacterium sp. KACC 21268]
MKRILSIITIVLFLASPKVFSQIDKNGNPIFNSLHIEKFKFENIEIVSNYYTIKNNIDNQSSSVFISEKPTSEDYINFSTKLPSYFFMIVDKGNVLGMAMLIPKIEDDSFFYNVVIPSENSNFQVSSQLKGKITEHRAKEILDITNAEAKIKKTVLNYNDRNFEILKYDQIIAELKNIVLAKITSEKNVEKNNIEEYIKTESKEGGKLDFKNAVEKYDGALVGFDGVMYNKKDFTILMWGASVNQVGIKDFAKTQALWEEINNRKLTEPELKALKKGFETKLK